MYSMPINKTAAVVFSRFLYTALLLSVVRESVCPSCLSAADPAHHAFTREGEPDHEFRSRPLPIDLGTGMYTFQRDEPLEHVAIDMPSATASTGAAIEQAESLHSQVAHMSIDMQRRAAHMPSLQSEEMANKLAQEIKDSDHARFISLINEEIPKKKMQVYVTSWVSGVFNLGTPLGSTALFTTFESARYVIPGLTVLTAITHFVHKKLQDELGKREKIAIDIAERYGISYSPGPKSA